MPREISQTNGGFVAVSPQLDGTEEPLLTMYEASVSIEQAEPNFLPGFFGQARIRVADATLAERLYRYLGSLFNFR